MSSRNVYLSASERKDALVLHQSLNLAKKIFAGGERRVALILSDMMQLFLAIPAAQVDYIKIVDAETFDLVDDLIEGREYFVLIACKIGKTRLIDNMKIRV
jgi:pantoate--beta-alanine ligase